MARSRKKKPQNAVPEATPVIPPTPYNAWTDGSVRPRNPGFGSAAFILQSNDKVWLNGWWLGGNITNNKAELQAILDCVGYAQENNLSPLTIHSDSEWAVNCVSGKYKARHNLGLIRAVQSHLTLMPDVRLVWTRGHASDPFNNFIDKFAGIVVRIPQHKYFGEFSREDFLQRGVAFLREYENLVTNV